MAARRPMAVNTPSPGHDNSDHSDLESDTEKEARYERIKDQSPTREVDEGDEIADGLVWALRPGVVAEQEADDFLDGIGEILDETISTEQPEVAPQGDLIQDNSDHSDSGSDNEKEANYEQIRDQSPTMEIDEGDEIADGLIWALRPGVVAEQEADDFLDGIGEILDETMSIEQPEVAPQGDLIQDNSEHSDSGSDNEKEASYERIRDQSPTREIEGGDEIADGLVWALRPGVVAEQEVDDFLDSTGENLDEQMDIEEPDVAPQADQIEADLMQVDRIQHQQQAEYIAAEQLQQALLQQQQQQQAEQERQRVMAAEQLQQSQRLQAEQNFLIAQAQAQELQQAHERYQAEQNAQAQAEAYGRYLLEAKELQEAQRAQKIEAEQLQQAIALQQAQEAERIAARQFKEAQELRQAQEAHSRHKAEQSFSPQPPTFTSPSSSPYVTSTPSSSSPPAASPLLLISTPPFSTPPVAPPQASFIPPSPSPALPKKLQKQKREESSGLNEGKKRKRDEELAAASSPPSPSPPLSPKRQKQTTGESPGSHQGEKRVRAEELAATPSPPSTSPPPPQKNQKQPMEYSPRVKQGKKRERDDELELPRKKTVLSPLPYAASPPRAPVPGGEPTPKPIPAPKSPVTSSPSAVSPARAPLPEREPAPCPIPAPIASVAPSSRAVSLARAASPAPMPRAPTSPNTSNSQSGLAEAIEYYRDLPALRAEIAWFRQQNELAKKKRKGTRQAKKAAAEKRLRSLKTDDGGWGRYRERR